MVDHKLRPGLWGTKLLDKYWPYLNMFQINLVMFSSLTRKRAEYGFGEYGFKHRTQWAFWGSLSSGGANSVSSSRPIICVPKRTQRVFRRTHRVCRRTQWVLFSETVLSKQYSARFLLTVCALCLSLFAFSVFTWEKMSSMRMCEHRGCQSLACFVCVLLVTCSGSRPHAVQWSPLLHFEVEIREGNLPLRGSLRGSLRGRVSEVFRGFQRFSELFRGF